MNSKPCPRKGRQERIVLSSENKIKEKKGVVARPASPPPLLTEIYVHALNICTSCIDVFCAHIPVLYWDLLQVVHV